MVDTFGQMSFTQKTGLIYPGDDEGEEVAIEGEQNEDGTQKTMKKEKKKRGDKYSQFSKMSGNMANSIDIQNLYSTDPNKIDIISNLTSIKLM